MSTSFSILLVRALVEGLECVGVSRDQLLMAAGIDPERLDESHTRLTLAEYNRAVLAALELSGDEALGLHLGEQWGYSAFDLLGHLITHVTTLRQGIETITHYYRILGDIPPEIMLYEECEIASIRFAFPCRASPSVRLSAEMSNHGSSRRTAVNSKRPDGYSTERHEHIVSTHASIWNNMLL
ncbi:MAG: AraC family transcriptional regulator ligand-binding domain-containing protein [Deltaproteobacteria bacterium]|nr:AraC family transcriptional regulator ligand-binding domain-containing protein [Deltaproteobacteria bacterium]